MNKDPTLGYSAGVSYSSRPDRVRLTRGNERSIITSIFNRIAIDVEQIGFKHCQLDDNGRFKSEKNTGLNACLTLEANIDQTSRSFIRDTVLTMFDEGVAAVVPVDTLYDPTDTDSYDITSMRVGKITEWFPYKVKIRLYNERTGRKEDIILPKRNVAIIENPMYAVINEYNSVYQRLARKLSLLDITDEQTASGKLDLIIQLPYIIKTEQKRREANQRRQEIEDQLSGSKYGIAYADGTEKITQLNRSLENNLLKQIETLQEQLYAQLGITQSVLDGTADEKTMLNYNSRTIEPIASAIADEFKRKFLTKTAITQGQSITYFKDPFKLVPVSSIAEIADKFTRNEIMTSNEIRQIIGMMPSSDPKADELINSNIAQPNKNTPQDYTEEIQEGEYQNG
nr:phage portal protein [Coprococcus sp. OM06-25]